MQFFFDFFNTNEISKFVRFNFSSDQFIPNSSKKRTFDLLPPVGFHKLLKPLFPMKFNITVPVKPYVKRFLENNYGNPVDFRNHPRESEMFIIVRIVKTEDPNTRQPTWCGDNPRPRLHQ